MRLGWHIHGGRRLAPLGPQCRHLGAPHRLHHLRALGRAGRLSGVLYAARLGSAGSDTGVGLEIAALTAAVLGGVSLGGGRGSVVKAMLGAVIVLIIQTR